MAAHSPRLSAMAFGVKLDSFTRVKKAIDDMITQLTAVARRCDEKGEAEETFSCECGSKGRLSLFFEPQCGMTDDL